MTFVGEKSRPPPNPTRFVLIKPNVGSVSQEWVDEFDKLAEYAFTFWKHKLAQETRAIDKLAAGARVFYEEEEGRREL